MADKLSDEERQELQWISDGADAILEDMTELRRQHPDKAGAIQSAVVLAAARIVARDIGQACRKDRSTINVAGLQMAARQYFDLVLGAISGSFPDCLAADAAQLARRRNNLARSDA